MTIIDNTRSNGNATLRSDSASLAKWFNRTASKAVELRPLLRNAYDKIDHGDDVMKLISLYIYGSEEVQ